MKAVTVQRNPRTAGRISSEAAQRRKSRDGGQSLMEFAFLLPVLCLIAIGIVEIGRAAAFTIAVNNGATAGVEYGSQNEADAQDFNGMVKAATTDASFSFGTMTAVATNGCTCDLNGSGKSCSYPVTGMIQCSQISCPSGPVIECVQVTTHGTWTSLFHYPGLPSSYQANGQAVMRVRR